jgi:hypothetical protein
LRRGLSPGLAHEYRTRTRQLVAAEHLRPGRCRSSGHVGLREKASALRLKADILRGG